MVATDSLPLFEAEAKERKTKGAAVRDHRETIPEGDKGKATEKAAAAVGVNHRYVSDAKAIKEASPELAEKVRAGDISIPQAKKQIWDAGRAARACASTTVQSADDCIP